MLVIMLNPGKSVAIGPDIKVFNNNDHSVRLSIEAPKEVKILRETAKQREPKD